MLAPRYVVPVEIASSGSNERRSTKREAAKLKVKRNSKLSKMKSPSRMVLSFRCTSFSIWK